MRKSIKKAITACLSVAAGVCMALSGVFAMPLPVSAELVSVSTKDLVKVADATTTTVTPNKSVNAAGVKGLAVESEGAYSGELNATFTGNLDFSFIFPGAVTQNPTYGYGDLAGAFEFTVSDAVDSSNCFTIRYEPVSPTNNNKRVAIIAEYNDGTKTYKRSSYTSGSKYSPTALCTNAGSYLYTGLQYPAFNNATAYKNRLVFEWSDDPKTDEVDSSILTLKYYGEKYCNTVYSFISFDGSQDTVTDATSPLTTCGVPKIAFPNGYKISFKSTYETGTDVCFTNVGDIDLGTETEIDADVVADSLNVNGVIVKEGDEIAVASGTDITVSALSQNVLKGLGASCGTCSIPAGEQVVSYTGTYNKDAAGTYALSAGGINFSVKVIGVVDVEDFISTDATVQAMHAYNSHGSTPTTGLGVVSEGAYSATFNATFTGDLSFNYLFPDVAEAKADDYYGDMQDHIGQFQFTIYDAVNTDVGFKISFANGRNSSLAIYAEYTVDGTTYVRVPGGGANFAIASGGWYGWQPTGYNTTQDVVNGLKFVWEGDVLTVYTEMVSNGVRADRVLISFDGLEAATVATTPATLVAPCGVPKIAFPNGYKVAFSSSKGTDVCFTQIGNLNLAENDKAFCGESVGEGLGEVIDKDGNVLNSGDTVSVFAGVEFGVREGKTVALSDVANATILAYMPFEYTGDLDLNTVGNYVITAANDPTFTLNVEVKENTVITYKVGEETVDTVITGVGETIFLANAPAAVAGKTFLGWSKGINDGIYKAGASYAVTGSATMQAMYVDMNMVAGASIRKSTPSGIRFTSKIAAADFTKYDGVMAIGEMGTLVIPTDLLSDNDFTVEGVQDVEHLNIVRTTWLSDATVASLGLTDTEGYKFFAGVMTNVQLGNYYRDFAARSYMQVCYADGSSAYVYSDYVAEDNVRSVYEVATKSLEANEADPSGELQKIVNGVANVTVTHDGSAYAFANANAQSTSVVSGSVAANATNGENFTITVSNAVSVVVLNGVEIYEDTSITVGESTIAVKGMEIVNGENGATVTFTTGNTYAAKYGVDAALKTALSGKTVSIFGDSISTYNGVSTGGNPWYNNTNKQVALEETWWKQVIDNYGMNLGVNASKGGIGFFDPGAGCTQMVQSEVDKLNLATTDNDLVMLFLGTNDSAAVSNLNGVDGIATYADIVANAEKKAALEAADGLAAGASLVEKYYQLLWQVCTSETNAKIVLVTPYDADGVAIKAIIEDLAAGFAAAYGNDIAVVDLTATELATSCAGDHALMDGATSVHPNAQGMDVITSAVIETLKTLYTAE